MDVISSTPGERWIMIGDEARRLVEALASPAWADRFDAARRLEALGARAASALVGGARHYDRRVRAESVALMDHLADGSCLAALRAALHDESARVRRLAVHSLGCQRCKVAPLDLDVIGLLIDRSLNDMSIRVRRVAVHQLGLQPRDPRAIEALRSILSGDPDAKMRSRANQALKRQGFGMRADRELEGVIA
jgi:HEAT repeat protein